MKNTYVLYLLMLILTAASCRKDTGTPKPPVSNDTTEADRIKDTAIAYARDIYLWNDQIPADFDARSYDGPEEIMTAIRAYSKEPGFTDPVDHYSFAMLKQEWDNLSNGVITDFGMNVFFFDDGDLRVRQVEPASPAGTAGVHRGWKIVSIAGSSNITVDNADFIISNVYESPSTAFTFEKPDGSRVDISLTASTYQESPLALDTIYSLGGRKAGYMVLNSFLGDTATMNAQFQQAFSHFASQNVTDLIIDLRYNGGGYVSLQEALADYVVKNSADGSIMMTQEYNNNYSDLNLTTKFSKKGSLDINNIYFIVTDNTASASELLINNMKPYMNVKLVGEPTYGKPVGFFPIDVADFYIFPVSFRSTNGQGEGNYFEGIAVDQAAADGLDKDWGDTSEASLATVLTHIRTGAFAFAGDNSRLESPQRSRTNTKLSRTFKGAVGKGR